MKVITLTTDFGVRDWFAGTMKGIILGLCPEATIMDITHEIPPADIRSGAFALAAGCGWFPKGTVHVAVVDPGVGSLRAAIAVQTKKHFFVGPDNGVLSFALKNESIKSVRRLENQDCFLRPVSTTFHGRDIFAPVAARLCCGLPMHRLGPTQSDFVRLRWPDPTIGSRGIRGEIVYIDRFGNLITNVARQYLQNMVEGPMRFKASGAARSIPLANHYQAVPEGRFVLIIGSAGLLEISVNAGSAADQLKMRVGDSFMICRAP